MALICSSDQKEPFLVPFTVALLFGLPASWFWFVVATKVGLLATLVTILLGVCCGLGARVSGGGTHPAGAAVLSTLALIVLNISAITAHLIAQANGLPFWATVAAIAQQGEFDFANACVEVAGRTFYGYPLGLYAAYRVSDAT